MSYDQKCFDLAKAFLEDEPDLDNERGAEELAQAIQEVIEAWIEEQKK